MHDCGGRPVVFDRNRGGNNPAAAAVLGCGISFRRCGYARCEIGVTVSYDVGGLRLNHTDHGSFIMRYLQSKTSRSEGFTVSEMTQQADSVAIDYRFRKLDMTTRLSSCTRLQRSFRFRWKSILKGYRSRNQLPLREVRSNFKIIR